MKTETKIMLIENALKLIYKGQSENAYDGIAASRLPDSTSQGLEALLVELKREAKQATKNPSTLTVSDIWEAIEQGKTVCWINEGYQVMAEMISGDIDTRLYQSKHFTCRGNRVLTVRFVSNYFGGLMTEEDLKNVYVRE